MKLTLTALLHLVTFPAVVGTRQRPSPPLPTPRLATRFFSWVPTGGFLDRIPYGQCTWWAAYNRRLRWSGNAGDWLANAQAQRVTGMDGLYEFITPLGDQRFRATWK